MLSEKEKPLVDAIFGMAADAEKEGDPQVAAILREMGRLRMEDDRRKHVHAALDKIVEKNAVKT